MRIPPEAYPPGFADYLQPLLDARLRFLEKISSNEKLICREIIAAFPELGRGPTVDELAERTGLPQSDVKTTLSHLNDRDMLKYDAETGCVIALYPFSDVLCPHQVQLAGKQRLYAM